MLAVTMPSMRSMNPPWPGIKPPESFTPKCRFKADSARSPHCATNPMARPRPASQSGVPVPVKNEKSRPAKACGGDAAQKARPGLVRGNRRPELRSADGPPADVGCDIRHGDGDQHEQRCEKSQRFVRSQPAERNDRQAPCTARRRRTAAPGRILSPGPQRRLRRRLPSATLQPAISLVTKDSRDENRDDVSD